MLSVLQLYYGFFVFWGTYFVAAGFFPNNQVITRPIAKITSQKVAKRLLSNVLISSMVVPMISYIPTIVILPYTWYGYTFKYILMLLISEIWFYYMHRLMHHKLFYKWHADHHSFIQSYATAGLYCSWVEMILVNQLTIAIPLQLLNFSLIEIMFISMLVALNVLKGHAVLHLRTDVPKWIPEILSQSWDHDIHHKIMVKNFGILYLLDRIHGTYSSNS